jgi:hypothetical protein
MSLVDPAIFVSLVVAAALPGAFAATLFGKRFADDPVEFAFAALSLGLLILGWPALLLAETGRFSAVALGIVWAVLTLGFAAVWLDRRRISTERQARHLAVNQWELAALGVWLAVAGWLFFRPHEFVIGGADAGVYINLGANIAKTGRILIDDPLLASLDPGQYPAWLRAMPADEAAPYYILPGFYVTGAPRGQIIPQFYPLHPVWQAVGFAFGGLRLELWMTPLWGVLGCLAVYMMVRWLWGWKVGLLALIGLSMTALQIWFARYPTAEMLTQCLLWTATWALSGWLAGRAPRNFWAALAGLALGAVFLTRIDTYVLLIVPLLAAWWLTWRRDWRRGDAWFFATFGVLAAHSLLHGLIVSRPYFWLQIRAGAGIGRPLLAPLVATLTVALVLGMVLAYRGRQRLPLSRLPGLWSALRWIAAAAVIALAVYAYFLRPQLAQLHAYPYWYGGGQVSDFDHENLVRLGWYLSPLGLALAALGAAVMVVKELDRRTMFMFGTGLTFSFLFLWHIGANPHQIYAMRRYVPYVLPFCIVMAVYLLQWLYRRRTNRARWLAAGLTMLWLVGILISARGFVRQVDYAGVITQFDRLNAALEPRSVLIFNDPAPVGMGDFLGTPLRFLYGHDVLVLRDPNALDAADFERKVRDWQAQGRGVYWVSVENGYPWPARGLTLSSPQEHALNGVVLEGSYDHKPQKLVDFVWPVTFARVRDATRQ